MVISHVSPPQISCFDFSVFRLILSTSNACLASPRTLSVHSFVNLFWIVNSKTFSGYFPSLLFETPESLLWLLSSCCVENGCAENYCVEKGYVENYCVENVYVENFYVENYCAENGYVENWCVENYCVETTV